MPHKMKMATPNNVPPLSTIAFYRVVRACWHGCGAEPLFVKHASDAAVCSHRPGPLKSHCLAMTLYFKAIDRTVKEILTWDCLPRNLTIKLANCFIDFDRNMREFIFSLSTAQIDFSKRGLQKCIENIAVTADGRIDKRKTLINIALSCQVSLLRSYTAYFCVGQKAVLKELKRRYDGTNVLIGRCPELGYMSVLSFCNPDSYWARRCHFAEMDNKFFQCVTVYGTKEAMEYFLPKTEPSERQNELAKAAVYMVAMRSVSLEKLMFFYKHMEASVWIEFLKRYFSVVFPEFMCSKRYRHMCLIFFRQVQEHLDYRIHYWVIEYLADQFSMHFRNQSHKELLLGDAEPLLMSVWRMTPKEYKEDFGHKVFKILNKLMYYEKFNVMAMIIEDPVYNERQKIEMVASMTMNLIVHKRISSVGKMLKKLKPGTCGDSTRISDLLTYDNIKVFIMLSDHCKHVNDYNRIMAYKFTSVCEMKIMKRKLLMDTDFMSGIVDAIKQPQNVLVQDFQKLVAWCFCNNESHAYTYMLNYLLPFEYMTSIFRNYLMGTRKTFYSITGFTLTESQVQGIRRSIASDSDLLYAHWATLINEQDYTAIKCLLQTVFNHQAEREHFLVNFFNSAIGVSTLYNLIMEDTFDEEFHCYFEFRSKLRAFLRFRQHVVITDQLATTLDGILQHYGHPNSSNFSLKPAETSSLFPYESVDAMRVVNDANYRIFRCLICCDLMVDFITDMLMMIRLPLSHITELSVMYELHAGISVPVIL